MEKQFDDANKLQQLYDLPVASDHIDTEKISSSPYFQTYTSAWYKRFPKPAEDYVESPEEVTGPITYEAPKCARRLFPLIMVFAFALLALAVAIIGIFKIEAIADYIALSGKYASVKELFDCFSAGGTTLEGIFMYILPVALYLSLAVVLIIFVISIVGFCKCDKICGLAWLALVAFLLGVLAAVSLYLVLGAPDFANFIDFGGVEAIGYGFLAIIALELLAFIFALFAYKKD